MDKPTVPSGLRSTVLVTGWELRRLFASRLNLFVGFGAFCFFVVLIGIKHLWLVPVESGGHRGIVLSVFGSSALGASFEIVGILLLFFGMLVPFFSAGAVSHDYQDRVHEIVMATPMPAGPYVVGRFLAAVITGLGAACVLLVAIVAANSLIHASDASFPAQDLGALVITWLVLVLPAVVFLTGISFLLGTALPRLSTPIKVSVVLFWALLSVVVDVGHGLGWFAYWTPTGTGVLKVVPQEVAAAYAARIASGATAAVATRVQNATPDLWPWAGPHLGLGVIGVAAGVLAALSFRRFRGVMQ